MTTQVSKLSVVKSAGVYEYQGAVINVEEITSSGKLKGKCTLSDGTCFKFTNSASGLSKRFDNGGKTTKNAVIPCGHADHSTCHGEHVTKTVSGNKRAKQHRKLMLALSDIKDVLPDTSDDIVNIIHSRWFEYSSNARRAEAEAEARKAEIAAKKRAEAEAKEQRALINTVANDFQALSKYMTPEQALVMLSNKYGADCAQSVVFGMI